MKRQKTFIICSFIALAAVIVCIIFYTKISADRFNINKQVVYQNKIIKDVYTDKSAYRPDDKVNYIVQLKNDSGKNYSGKLKISILHLNKTIENKEINIDLKQNEAKEIKLQWTPPKEDYKGYMIEVYAQKGTKLFDYRNTAVDVSSDWNRFPRYGYIADFPEMDKNQIKDIVDNLSKFHINGLQFYDWQFKHDTPLAGAADKPAASWNDIANRTTSSKTVKNYIDFAHEKNMMAANYNLMFGAFDDYESRGVKKEWGLYKDEQHNEQDAHPLPSSWATSHLYLMNPASIEWQNYIFEKEKEAMSVYNFDVFHVDTLGPRGTLYDYNGKEVKLDETYTEFLNNAKKALNKRIVLNTVSEYGKIPVAKGADVDFLYTEIWPPSFSNYGSIKRTIDNDLQFSEGKKASVIAAYMNYGLGSGEEFNEHSVRLTDASIFAAGGAHIELGDTGMLSKEYFPNKDVKMSQSLVDAMRKYYDFLAGYENILRDNMKDVDTAIEIPGIETSDDGTTETVWTYSKENDKYQTVQLINLLNREVNSWRDDDGSCTAPEIKKDFVLKLYVNDTKVKSVNLASPDLWSGNSIKLKYSKKEDSKGKYLEIKVPELQYWDTIFIEK